MRYAIYFTPPRQHALTIAASTWLGRDAFAGAPLPVPAIGGLTFDEIEPLVVEPRRYGFHGTIVAPFRLADGATEEQLLEALNTFCAQTEAFVINAMLVAKIGSFLAITPRAPQPNLNTLAANAVQHFAPFRAPLNRQEIQRRNPSRLSPRQADYLERYGYPYVMEEFRFHMTLTGSLEPETAARVQPILERAFTLAISAPLMVDALALFIEPAPGAPFVVRAYEPFSPATIRKTA